MRRILKGLGFVLLVLLALGTLAAAYIVSTGLRAKPEPLGIEKRVARAARGLAIPGAVKRLRNPVAASPQIIEEGLSHFADHCASCHGNDGSGQTELGRGLFPKAPDMRLAPTQELTDGELFYIVENGVRFTGMPSWGDGTKSGAESTWHLVHFIRHLPSLTADELERMRTLNPRSPEEIRQELEEERFLGGADDTPQLSATTPARHDHKEHIR